MSSLAADTTPQTETSTGIYRTLSLLVLVLWIAAGALSCSHLSAVETANAGGLLVVLLGSIILMRNASAAESAAARLWSAALFVFGTLVLSPAFQYLTTARDFREWDRLTQLSAFAPVALMGLLWGLTRAGRMGAASGISSGGDVAAKIEAFILTFSVRLQGVPLVLLVTAAGLGLSGQPLRAILPRTLVLAPLLLLGVPALLRLAATSAGTRMLHAALALGLTIATLNGVWRYADLRGKVAQGAELLTQDKPDEAQKAYAEAAVLNEVLQSKSVRFEIDTRWAEFYERKEQYETALVHWRRIADAQGIDTGEMQPIRRILIKMGDSLAAWRRLIYQGFPAIRDPEIAPGIRTLGEKSGSDLRAKLLAALLSWEQNEPEAERRRRLEEVRKVLPNEPSANVLLRRMGSKIPDAPLWLPAELIVGKNISTSSLLGSVEELGEVDTVVVLDEGHWELALNARATPLNEEWPIIRLEFNGQEIARTQVTHYDNRDVPFTFDVKRGDIYRVKVIFENRQETLEQGHITRRGLVLNGMTFRRAKE